MMIDVNHLMITKNNITIQDGKPLTINQAQTLEADHRVESFWTEAHDMGGRTIWVRLANGYNYEARRNVVGVDWREITWNMKSIQQGAPDTDEAE